MPFKKGDPNINRKGRPREGATLTDLLKEKLDKDRFIERLIELAESGNTRALEMIYDRIDGKVKEQIEIQNKTFADWVKSLDDKQK